MASKRIYQIAKELERDEKEIIEFLTSQGIKVTNKLSAVNEETYNILKAKYTAPPEPEPVPEPEPEPVVEEPAQIIADEIVSEEQAPAPGKKKKKKKKKSAQPDATEQDEEQPQDNAEPQDDEESPYIKPINMDRLEEVTREVYSEAIAAGNAFIKNYGTRTSRKKLKLTKPKLTQNMDTWGVLHEFKFECPDTSPARYWQAVARLTTMAFRLMNEYGLSHREILAELRELTKRVGSKYEPREIFTDEENLKFEAQHKFMFVAFSHGMGAVNDNLYALKMKAERMKSKYEMMNFVDYIANPDDELRGKDRPPFAELVDAITFSISSIPRRVNFYNDNKGLVTKTLENFYAWIDGYATLKEQGADSAKLEKYLYLEQKFFDLVEFMSFDNLVFLKKNKPAPFETVLDLLNDYRDNMDDPDAERNFKYKVRGVAASLYKPKEYVFLYQFADLEPLKDYRPPEEIAAAEAAKAQADAEAKAAAEAQAAESAQEESPAESDEA